MYTTGQYSIVMLNPAIAPQMLISWRAFEGIKPQAKNVVITPAFAQFQLGAELIVSLVEGRIDFVWRQADKKVAKEKLLPLALEFASAYRAHENKGMGINSLGKVEYPSTRWKGKLLNQNFLNSVCDEHRVQNLEAEVKLSLGFNNSVLNIKLSPEGEMTQVDINNHFAKLQTEKELVDAINSCLDYWTKSEEIVLTWLR